MKQEPSEDASGSGSAFGEALSHAIERYRVTRSEVASRLGTSRAYVSGLTTGVKHASSRTVDEVADVIGASPEDRVELHRAAARDAGFKLDLPEGF